MSATIAFSTPFASSMPSPGIAAMTDSTADRPKPAMPPRDYYQLGAGTDETGERWYRYTPVMQVFGFVVLGAAAAIALPRESPPGPRFAVATATLAALAVAFFFMWVRGPIWRYPVRTLVVHGAFQLVAYTVLVLVSPAFAVVGLLVYPQVVFSLAPRLSVAGGLYLGLVTGLAGIVHSNGDPASALPGLVANLLVAGFVVAMAVFVRESLTQSLERRSLIDELRSTRSELAAAERAAAVADERARLAREIHDTLAQGFASVVAHLEAADAALSPTETRAREDVRAAEEVARSSLAEARTLVWALRPETIATAGLPAAIRRVAAARASEELAIEVEVSGEVRPLDPEIEVTLLRAAQEALANASQHAAARHAKVTLTFFADEVTLDVADDGRGFDPADAASRGGMGLVGMRERVGLLGGSVAIESAPGEGTVVAVTLPAVEPPVPAPVQAAAAGPEAVR